MTYLQMGILVSIKLELGYCSIITGHKLSVRLDYCRSCDRCQRLGKGPNPTKVPLQSLPLVSGPSKHLIIDIVGPECKYTGNTFILTVMDASTHYPTAIPLKHHTAKDVALGLMSVWSCFGFCRAMRCTSVAYVGMRCLSVCLSHSWIMSKWINISSKFIHHRVATPF